MAWLLTDLVATYGVIHYLRGLGPLAPAQAAPAVLVIVAIKGVSESTPRFLEALCNQQYPAYRLVLAVESTLDPAFALLGGLRDGRIQLDVVIAGEATKRAQKVHNLLAALCRLRDDDRIVVFADSDILPDARWLSQLVRPIATGEVGASTGYRWQLPTDRRWPTLAVAAADLSIATAARSWRWNVCWGGSTAIDRAALDRVDLPTLWDHAASDDLTLTQALRANGIRINQPIAVLVPSPVAHTWASLFSFAHRQYLLVRIYAPRHWVIAGWSLCVPTLAAATAIGAAMDGRRWTMGVLLASAVLLEVRMAVRRRIAERVLPLATHSAARATIGFAQWAWPLVHLIHCAAFLTSCAGRRFTWAGIDYRLHRKTVVVQRPRAGSLQIGNK